ncbi:Ti-type conjugative transfer relaxase TraA [Desulforegula conservatrix]|uniref:Ti-type conjugative transfer relaxase TraA n=1 Tax=Desulforegula conservatrix TaxID=153026 RepID=UPI000418899A|nr:Ti-type conjugative transfer relaxase TraA [Desulforegula conservatrix]
MAIYRLSSQIISRTTGRTVTGAAAYRAGEKILDERMNQTWDFTKKKGIDHTEILSPENAPEWAYDRETLWNKVEKAEKRDDAQLAREIQIALPVELTSEQKKNLIKEFAKDNFVEKGMIADICIHDISGENPHAHIMLTMRDLKAEGFGNKNRDWNKKEHLLGWRENWAKLANDHLALAGHDISIDHRSYEKMGIPLEAQKKIGPLKHISKEDRAETDRMQEYLETCRRNGEKIKANPEIATDLFSRKQAVFTENDILRLANTYSADKEQFNEVVSAIKKSRDLVLLGAGEHGKERYTTRQTLEAENSMLSKSENMAKAHNHKVREKYQKQAKASRTLSPEQVNAFDHIFASGDMCCVVGYAGTGKSYMLDAVREAYEAGGYSVTGAALAGIAAQGLFESSGIPSQTIARRLLDQEQGRSELTSKHVLVIDEAGMVGTRQMNALISHAHEKGAKVILVGDGMQLQPIEAGGAFRGIYSRTEGVNLTEIRRQKEDWQKEATKYFEEGKSKTALDLYELSGKIRQDATHDKSIRQLTGEWSNHVIKTKGIDSSMMMAYRNKDVEDLNNLGRQAMIKAGFVRGEGKSFETTKGLKKFAEGDRILFLKNDRFMGVNNGNRGTVEKISGNDFLVRMDNKEKIAFDASQYQHFNHGYAATVHKLQGATIKHSFVLADSYFDQHSILTAMSRHTDDAQLYYSLERFQEGFQELRRVIGRKKPKDLAIDFAVKRGIDPSSFQDNPKGKDTLADILQKKAENFVEFFTDIFRSNSEIKLREDVQAKRKKELDDNYEMANRPSDPAKELIKFKNMMADIHGGTDKQRREMVLETIDELISKGVIDYPHKQGSLSADKSQEEKSKARAVETEKPKFERIIAYPEISEQNPQKSMEIKSSQKTAAPKSKMILEVYESQEQSFKARASEIENQKQKTKEPVTIPVSAPKKEKTKEKKQAEIHKSKGRDIEMER